MPSADDVDATRTTPLPDFLTPEERNIVLGKQLAGRQKRLRAVSAACNDAIVAIEKIDRQLASLRTAASSKDSSELVASVRKLLTQKENAIRTAADAISSANALLNPLDAATGAAHQVRPLPFFLRLFYPRLGRVYQHWPVEMRLPPPYVSRRAARGAMPTIAIVTPALGHGRFIEATLRSVLDQNYPALRYFVQDGASTDQTLEILQAYANRLSGWDSRKDSGQSEAINRGFAHVSGDIMAYLNSDDLLLPGALACVADYFADHPEVDVVYGNRILIDDSSMEIGRWVLPGHHDEALCWADYVPQETLFWRRAIWEKAGGRIDESFRFAMDWDLIMRFRDVGARFAHLPRFLGAFRIHPDQKTSAQIRDIGFQEMNRIRQRVLGRIPYRPEIRRALLPFMARHMVAHMLNSVSRKIGRA